MYSLCALGFVTLCKLTLSISKELKKISNLNGIRNHLSDAHHTFYVFDTIFLISNSWNDFSIKYHIHIVHVLLVDALTFQQFSFKKLFTNISLFFVKKKAYHLDEHILKTCATFHVVFTPKNYLSAIYLLDPNCFWCVKLQTIYSFMKIHIYWSHIQPHAK